MAYDENLANRIRELLSDEDSIVEKKMFGGLAFLLRGNMAVAAASKGGLLVRIDPSSSDDCLKQPHVALMTMGGRSMDGWLTVAPDGLRTQAQLASWVRRGVEFAKTLPTK